MNQKLVIGIDVRDLKVAKTGTKTYLEELVKAFKKLESNEINFHFLDTTWAVYTGESKLRKLIAHINYHTWKQLVLPFKAWNRGCNIVFCTDSYVPYLHFKFKTVPVFHDAFLFENPEHYHSIWLKIYLFFTISAAHRAAKIICPTHYSKKQILHYTKLHSNLFEIVYEGPKSVATPDIQSINLFQKFNIATQKYLLHVGVMDKRKNLPRLVSAFSKVQMVYPDIKLVLVGSTTSKKHGNDFNAIVHAIDEHHLQNKVILTGYLNDSQVAEMYRHATAYVFPSINEGFGIPILEAFHFQIPVAAANNTCLPEVGGKAIVKFDPFSIEDIANKIVEILSNINLRDNLVANGSERLKNFSWDTAAKQLLYIFRAIHQKS
nr:glycosyltransferase family 4 protein [Pseudopedobacter sp.]